MGGYKREDRTFYDPSLWDPELRKARYLGRWINPTRVEFDCDEERMVKELSQKTGYPRSEVVRESVRYLYDDVVKKGRWDQTGDNSCTIVVTITNDMADKLIKEKVLRRHEVDAIIQDALMDYFLKRCEGGINVDETR